MPIHQLDAVDEVEEEDARWAISRRQDDEKWAKIEMEKKYGFCPPRAALEQNSLQIQAARQGAVVEEEQPCQVPRPD